MKKKIAVLFVVLVVFVSISVPILRNTNLSALYEVQAALENNYGRVEITVEEKSLLKGNRYCLTFQNILERHENTMVTVYVYKNEAAAQKDAATITPDGFGIERKGLPGMAESIQISWVEAPHFFLYKNCIVQYVGTDFELLQTLRNLCGNQIAGRPLVYDGLICE